MKTKENVRQIIDNLNVNEEITFPLSRYNYIISCKVRAQLLTDKKFKSSTSKENKTIKIIRIE